MMSRIKKLTGWFSAIIMVVVIGGSSLVAFLPKYASAACDPNGILGFPAWYKGVVDTSTCAIDVAKAGGMQNFILRIGLNLVEIAMVAVVYIAVGFIIYGGFYFMTSNGKPDKAALARRMILDAVIGLGIGISAIAIINFVSKYIFTGTVFK
jgi:hypothetical protein